MVIIAALYLVLVWLVFSRLKLIRWGWFSGTVTALLGVFILAVFVALLNYLTPSGRIVVVGRVVEVTPNVSGQIVAIPVKPNEPVKAGAVLFQIDPTPFRYSVHQLEAALAAAKQNVDVLKANYEQQTANVEAVAAQLAYHDTRLANLQKALRAGAETEFRIQDIQVQMETSKNQLAAAKAAQLSARLQMESQVNGVNTTVAQAQAQLDNARWELEQTTVRAPADGYVTIMALAVGDRAKQLTPVLSFVLTDDITIVGMLPPNGFQTIKPGAAATLVFDDHPGRRYATRVERIPLGVGQGQVAVSGTLARSGSVSGVREFPAVLSVPPDADRNQLRLGMPGTVTVYAANAGVIGVIASILIWVSSYAAYL